MHQTQLDICQFNCRSIIHPISQPTSQPLSHLPLAALYWIWYSRHQNELNSYQVNCGSIIHPINQPTSQLLSDLPLVALNLIWHWRHQTELESCQVTCGSIIHPIASQLANHWVIFHLRHWIGLVISSHQTELHWRHWIEFDVWGIRLNSTVARSIADRSSIILASQLANHWAIFHWRHWIGLDIRGIRLNSTVVNCGSTIHPINQPTSQPLSHLLLAALDWICKSEASDWTRQLPSQLQIHHPSYQPAN